MRLIYTSNDQKQAASLSSVLANNGIENQLELSTNTDWGSPDYGIVTAKIWVIDEDQVDTAMKTSEEFQSNPQNVHKPIPEKLSIAEEPSPNEAKPVPVQKAKMVRPRIRLERQPIGLITVYIIMLCTLIFVIEMITEPKAQEYPSSLAATPAFSPPIDKELLYDYPKAFEIIDKIIKAYGMQQLVHPTEKPVEYLLEQYHKTPYWHGFYDQLLEYFKKGTPLFNSNVPMFEKLRQGEVWRLFTPALLHSGPFHIFFNMLWLIVLGKQMEQRLSKWRYLLFILLTGVVTNTLQYLMSGANFIGFSGVLCAMLTFVWVRQKRAAWEGYRLDRSTMAFMMLFLFTIFGIQAISFLIEITMNREISPGIANTAHMTGLASGYILGLSRYFNAK